MPNSQKKRNTSNSDSFDKFDNLFKKLVKVHPKKVEKPKPKKKRRKKKP